jgi:hypothetical protein
MKVSERLGNIQLAGLPVNIGPAEDNRMREHQIIFHLKDPDPGTIMDLGLRKFIATSAEERKAWAKFREEMHELAEDGNFRPAIRYEFPFDGRVLCPLPSVPEEVEFLVCSEQAYLVMNSRCPAANPLTVNSENEGLSIDQWSEIPESVGQGYGRFAATLDDKYALVLLSSDRQRSLMMVSAQETVFRRLIVLVPRPRLRENAVRKTLWRWEKMVKRSEILRIEARDYVSAFNALVKYRWYLDEVDDERSTFHELPRP